MSVREDALRHWAAARPVVVIGRRPFDLAIPASSVTTFSLIFFGKSTKIFKENGILKT